MIVLSVLTALVVLTLTRGASIENSPLPVPTQFCGSNPSPPATCDFPTTQSTIDCSQRTTLSSSYIGVNKDVLVESFSCSSPSLASRMFADVKKRQANVCGATCNTNCFTPAGGGPNPNECNVIADALLFDSENIGALFTINSTGTGTGLVMQYRSCKTFMINQDFVPLTYCRTDWASLVQFVAFNCQATQNAHGGNCVAADQRWFIQIQHS